MASKDWASFIEKNEPLIRRALRIKDKKRKCKEMKECRREKERRKHKKRRNKNSEKLHNLRSSGNQKKQGKTEVNKAVTISSPSQTTIYTGIVDRSTEYSDSSDTSINMCSNQKELQNLTLSDSNKDKELFEHNNSQRDLFLDGRRRQIPTPPGYADVRPGPLRETTMGERHALVQQGLCR